MKKSNQRKGNYNKSKRGVYLRPVVAGACIFLSMEAFADYPVANIKNNTEYNISGEVKYASAFCKNDKYTVAAGKTWKGKSRGVCLITGITGKASGGSKHGESTAITRYNSTGTSYAKFQINAFGNRYQIYSDAQYKNESKNKQGKSPGFRIVNKTDWPVAYSLDQVGCLYHGVVPSHWKGKDGAKTVDTGAVWFTLRANIQPNGVDPQSGLSCAEPVAEIVGDVLLAVATGGAGALAAAPKMAVKQAVKVAIKAAAKEALKVSTKKLAKTMVKRLGAYMIDAGSVTMLGQYAGYEWPFRCAKMPEYHITGGPKYRTTGGGHNYILPGAKFTVTKVNGCGNKMMLASPKSSSAKATLPFPVDKTIATAPATAKGNKIVSATGKCLDGKEGSSADGTPVIAWGCHGKKNQRWFVSGGKIINGVGKCLDIKGGKSTMLATCNNNRASQRWTVGKGVIKSLSGKCLDIEGGSTANGASVIVWSCHGGKNQR
ncbi:MAG TPA: hypothetical protein EYG68_02585, partial [Leucothrix mucor]|nr:hypothetical protein [Leucothrix mucor]